MKQFCLTAYVKEKLTDQQMKARGAQGFKDVFKQSLGKRSAGKYSVKASTAFQDYKLQDSPIQAFKSVKKKL
ncbi:MAG: hypothetical protein AAF560_01175 [Acidobacteriota bacterium]